MQGIFSNNIVADIVLVIQWIIVILLVYDWYIARQKNFKTHMQLVTTLFLVQLIFNIYMIARLVQLTELKPIVIIHGSLGFFAFIFITYTLLYMRKILPDSLRFVPKERRKLMMQVATILWILFTISGTLVYLTLYF